MTEHFKQLDTIQKEHSLNIVYRIGDQPGPGGAYHEYEVFMPPRPIDSDPGDTHAIRIRFQKGPRMDPASQHGVLDSDLLEIVRDRLTLFQQGEFATRENEMALRHVEEALLWMNKRVEDRAFRGVLGTYKK